MLDPFKHLIINTDTIVAKYNTILSLDESNYKGTDAMIETSTHFIVPGILYMYIPEKDDYCNFLVNYNIKIVKPSSIEYSKKVYTLSYQPNDIIVEQDNYIDETNISLITKLLEGRASFIKEPKELLLLLDQLGKIDICHLELLISNMFRCESDIRIKCRNKNGSYKNSKQIGQTAQPFVDSWLSAMAFQYIDRGIKTGLIYETNTKNNPLEKIIIEDFDNL